MTEQELKGYYNAFTDAWKFFRKWAVIVPMTEEQWEQAEGESTIFGVKHIERGYDTLEAALQSVGARLKTVEIPKKM